MPEKMTGKQRFVGALRGLGGPVSSTPPRSSMIKEPLTKKKRFVDAITRVSKVGRNAR